MLLQRLVEEATRRPDLPPPYYAARAIRWYIDLDDTGRLQTPALLPLNSPAAGEMIRQPTPYVYRSGTRPPATLLVDTLQYSLGFAKDDTAKAQRVALERHADYQTLIRRWWEANPGDPVAGVVGGFIASEGLAGFQVPDEAKPDDLFGIRVAGGWAHDQPSAKEFWAQVVAERKSTVGRGLCLVCGQDQLLLDTLPESVRGGAIPVAQGRGRDAQLISINKPAQGRGGSIQLDNTPVCATCGSRAIQILNGLLATKESHWRWRDSVLVWWSHTSSTPTFTPRLLDAPPAPGEVESMLSQLEVARPTPTDPDEASLSGHFYAVTLSVNQSRVVVRDWIDIPILEAERNIMDWFTDHAIADGWSDEHRLFPLWRLVVATGRWNRDRSRYVDRSSPHGLERQLLSAALRRGRLPATVLSHLLQRIRADAHLDPARMALIRLYLTRNTTTAKGATMPDLDPHETDPAYRSGRTFAVLEAVQRRALGREVNATVVDRLFRRAVTSPRSALIPARMTASGHLRKLRTSPDPKDKASAAALDRRLVEVWPGEIDLPKALDQNGQARFLAGYHHQRAADIQAARAHRGPTSPPDGEPDTDATPDIEGEPS